MLHLLTLLLPTAFAADHPCDPAFVDACVDPSTTVDLGAVVGTSARIGPEMAIGDAVIASRAILDGRVSGPTGQPVGDDTIIASRAHIGADASIGGSVLIGRSVQIGTDLTVSDNASIGYASQLGDNITLGAGAVVGSVTNIGDGSTVNGVVARSTSLGTGVTVNGIIGPDVQVGNDATVDGRVRKRSTVQEDAVIEDGARVGRDTTVGAGAVIEDGATVRAGATVPDCSRLTSGDILRRGETWSGDTTTGCIDLGSFPIDMVSTSGSGRVSVNDMAVDPASGRIYITGLQRYDAVFAGTPAPAGSTSMFVAAFNARGGLLWIQSPQDTGTTIAYGIAFHDGGLYVSGEYSSTVNIDGTVLSNVGPEPDLFVARLDPSDGSHVWSRPIQTNDNSEILDVVAGADGVYVAGEFHDTLTLAGATSLNLTSYTNGEPDGFLAKLDDAGTWSWSRRIGGSDDDTVTALAALPGGGVAAAVSFRGTLQPGTNALTSGQTSTASDDTILSIVDANGTATHTEQIAGSGNNDILALDASASRLVALTNIRGPFTFGNATLPDSSTLPSVLEFSPSGTPVTAYGITADDVATGQDIVLLGDVAAVGLRLEDSGTYTTGSHTITGAVGSVAALDLSSGTWLWANAITGDSSSRPRAMVAQSYGSTPGFVVSGRYTNTVQVGSHAFTNSTPENAWIVEVEADGTW